jgi:transposase
MPQRPDPKVQALRRDGALNPRPAAVKDELFQQSEFFDPRDLVQVRYELVRRVHSDGHPVAEATKRFGVSRPTYYKLSDQFQREGLSGLLPRKRGPKGGHKLRAEVIEALEAARAFDPTMDTAALLELAQQRFGVRVHPRTLARALARREKKRR